MRVSTSDRSCCIPSLAANAERLRLSRFAPSADLADFVDRYWFADWSLLGRKSLRSETLPHPCVNLVFSRGESRVFGVVRGRLSHTFRRSGLAFGVKFKPGGFFPFVKWPVAALTDSVARARDVFGESAGVLEAGIDLAPDANSIVDVIERFLRARLPKRDQQSQISAEIVDRIGTNRVITRVQDIVADSGLSRRTLHRLFDRYVGVGPKQVIKCFRLQEALHRMADGGPIDWSALAVEVGYFDQAHFINDFNTIMARTPTQYLSELRSARAGVESAATRVRIRSAPRSGRSLPP